MNLSIKQKVYLFVFIAFVSIILVGINSANLMKQGMLNERQQQLKYQVAIVEGIIDNFETQVDRGQITEEQAKQAFYALLPDLQYSKAGYFFAFTSDYILKATLKGAPTEVSVENVRDANGDYVYHKLLNTAKKNGGRAFVSYLYKKSTNAKAEEKISYTLYYKPWNIVVGTGSYISDIDSAVQKTIIDLIIIMVVVISLLLLVSFYIMKAIITPIKATQSVMSAVATGDLTKRVEHQAKDELGGLADSINSMLNAFNQLITSLGLSSQSINGASENLSVIAEQTSRGVNKQTEEIQSVVSAIEEMSMTIREVEANTLDVSESTQDTMGMLSNTSQMIGSTISCVTNASKQIENAVDVVEELKVGSSEIAEVLNVITGISDQTNLLALNAAIEAARAGEAGRGFAVVADEVRSLARSTQESTVEIQKIIEKLQTLSETAASAMHEGQQAASETVESAKQTGDTLKEVVDHVEGVNHKMSQIATATTEQSAVSDEVARAMMSINDVSVETGEASDETRAQSNNLTTLVEQLKESMGRFKTL